MKSRTILAGSILLLLLCAAPLAAQGVRPTSPDTDNHTPESLTTSDPPYYQRYKLTGEITRVDPDNNNVVVRESKTGANYTFHVNKDTLLRADEKTELAGRKHLSIADFKAGRPVRVTVRAADRKLLEVRLRNK